MTSLSSLTDAWSIQPPKKETFYQAVQDAQIQPQPSMFLGPAADQNYNPWRRNEAAEEEQRRRESEERETENLQIERQTRRENQMLAVMDQIVSRSHQLTARKIDLIAERVGTIATKKSTRMESIGLGLLIITFGCVLTYLIYAHSGTQSRTMGELMKQLRLNTANKISVAEVFQLMP